MIDVDSSVLGTFTITIPLAVLFLARALDGVTGGNVSVANAYLADITDDVDRSANFRKMAVSSPARLIDEMCPHGGVVGTALFRVT